MKTLLVKNGIVITLGENNRVLYNHSVLCAGDKISAVGPDSQFAGKYDKVIDARGRVVLPGFINAHMHFYSTLARGLGKAAPAKDFNGVLENLWWRLDKKLTLDDCYYSAVAPLVDSIRKGTTTLIDHHASPYAARGSLDAIAKAVRETGLRACLCYEVSDRDGEKIAADGIAENAEFIKRCEKEKDPRLSAMFGLHAAFTLSDNTLAAASAAGRGLETGFHIHCAEAAADEEFSEKNHGMRVVERLEKFGLLGPGSIAAHCVHVDEREMDILAATGTPVAHNPQSNLNNAVGIADVVALAKKGVLVGLGTDAMTVDMPEELRVALWAQHLKHGDASCGFMETLSTLLFNNAKIAARHFRLPPGELRAGCAADIIVLDYRAPTPLDAGTFLGHLCYGMAPAPVDCTIAGGRALLEEGELKLDLDLEGICRRSREAAAALWERF
ncbi:MAG: putative aminohydrolase SsnA [Elusimicrobiales bacterium]|nr:putative aminohydrolase SsnA [Elusimicrobiales bacterium]